MKRDTKKSLQKALSLFLAFCMMCSFIPSHSPVKATAYNTNLNTIQDMSGYGTALSGSQTIQLSQDDLYRVKNNELSYSASVYMEANGSREMSASIAVMCYDSADKIISPGGFAIDGVTDKYSVGKHQRTFSINDRAIPTNTVSIRLSVTNLINMKGNLLIKSTSFVLKDTVTPMFLSCYPITAAGKYPAGTQIRFCLKFSEPVKLLINSADSWLNMNAGGIAKFSGYSTDKTEIYYDYAIPISGKISDNFQISVDSFNGVGVQDDAGNQCIPINKINKGAIYMDNKPPEVSTFGTSASRNATYTAGEKIRFPATFTEYIVVNGSPSLNLNTGKAAYYIKLTDSDTKEATFEYTVQTGDNTSNLSITSVNFNGIKDKVGNIAKFTATQHNTALNGYNIKVDTGAPTATFNFIDSKKYYTSDLVVKTMPTDELSEIKEVYSAWSTIKAQPNFPAVSNVASPDYIINKPTKSGTYYLYTKIIDSSNNIGIVNSPYVYNLDFDKPTVKNTVTKIPNMDILKTVIVTAQDAHSGIKSISYKWKNSDNVIIASGNILNESAIPQPTQEGIFSLEVTAIDNVGNEETIITENLQTDSIAPEVSFAKNGDLTYLQSHSTTISIIDEKSGVDTYSYMWTTNPSAPLMDNANWISTTETTFTTPENQSGTCYLHIKVSDLVGNTKVCSSEGFNVDNTFPSVSITPNGNVGDIGRPEYVVGITISDLVTPNKNIVKKYVISDSETCPTELLTDLTEESVIISNITKNLYLYISATDTSGNTNIFKSNAFAADITAPVGSITKVTDKYFTNLNIAELNLTATDDYAQIISMQFEIDSVESVWEEFITQKTLQFGIEQKEHIIKVRYKDECENISPWYEIKYYYDITAPTIEIVYDNTNPTNQAVKATATASDGDISKVTFETESSKVFNENGIFMFTAIDEAGNRTNKIATVSNIDKTVPTITFTSKMFDNKNHKNAEVKVDVTDLNIISSIEYRFIKDGETGADFIPCKNGDTLSLKDVDGTYKLEVKAADCAGNVGVKTSTALLLDNTAPTAEISYTPSTRTAGNVVSKITTNELTTITNNNGGDTYEFLENGDFTYEFADEAGNTAVKTATVNFIDRTVPTSKASLTDTDGKKLSLSDWSNKNIQITLAPPPSSVINNIKFNNVPIEESEYVTILNDGFIDYYEISVYGKLTFTTKDTETLVEGNGEVEIRVDKEVPSVSNIVYTTKDPTNQDVTVTITAKDNLTTVNYSPSNSHVFSENGEFEFIISDLAGNEILQTVTVNNIDKETPKGLITYTANDENYDLETYTNKNVIATIEFPNEILPVRITNNSGNAFYEFTTNGQLTFEFIDAAGNIGTATAKIDKIDKIAPSGYVTYSINGWTNQDVVATLHAKDDITEIVYINNPDENYTFTQNGEFSFEIMDLAKNTVKISAFADRIDKTPPELSYKLTPPADNPTPFSVFAQVISNEPITILNSNKNTTVQFKSNGTYVFKTQDRAKNYAELEVVVANISRDTTPAKIEYSETEPTNKDVFAKIVPQNPNDIIFVTNNNCQKFYRFLENGVFTFEYTNNAGMEATVLADVSNIDKIPPNVTVKYSTDSLTNQDIEVLLSADKEVIFPYNVENGKYIFTQNEKVQIPVTDKAGNVVLVVVETNLIDKIAPEIKIDEEFVCLPLGENIDIMSGVFASDNVGLNGNILVEGGVDINTCGDYTIKYTSNDIAGNVTVKEKFVTVYDPNAFNIIINSKMPIKGQIISDTNDVLITTINASGNVTIKYLPNKKNIGDFKDNGTVIEKNHSFTESGYYTLYIYDDERQAKTVYLFVK